MYATNESPANPCKLYLHSSNFLPLYPFLTICATRRRLCSTRIFRASLSPFFASSRYFFSSSAFKGRGKEPLLLERRRVKNRLFKIKIIQAESIKTPPRPTYVDAGCPYVQGGKAAGIFMRSRLS